jgi:hypothetical protein
MATQLYILANDTPQNVTLTNTETSSDTAAVNTLTVVHTGGKDGDYCKIPDCSAAKYFDAHHMSITAKAADGSVVWTIVFWNNDVQNHLLYYSLDGTYAGGRAIQTSSQYKGISILVVASNDVRFFAY